ncbi:MAG: hypothetical protein ACOYOE_13795 [Chlorobium sp.]
MLLRWRMSDGQLKAADALNILKMTVKLSTAPEMEWLFLPGIVNIESMSRTHVVWRDDLPRGNFGSLYQSNKRLRGK